MKNGIVQISIAMLTLAGLMLMTGCKDPGGSGSSGSGSSSGVTATGDTIKIGMVASLNGPNLAWGKDSQEGALLAIDEINEAGGINGKKIELVVQDSNSKAEEGKTAAEKLLSEGVIGVLGEVASGITLQMKEVTVPKGIPLVAIGATNPLVTKDANNLVFRVCYTDDLQGPVMAKFAYDYLGLRKVAVMTDEQQPYSQGLSDAFMAAFKGLGGEIVTEQSYETGQNQFGPQITAMQGFAPQGIFITGYFPEVGPMARQIRAAGMKDTVLFGGDGWDSSEIVSAGGDAIVGSFLCNHYNNLDERPEVAMFLDKWKARSGGEVPGTTMAALGYDSAALVIDALKRMAEAGEEINSANLAKALSETEGFEGVSGTITLKGNNGDPPKRALVVKLEKDGSQTFVKAYEANEVQ